MNYLVKHIYNNKDNILVRKFTGSVNMTDVINSWQEDLDNQTVHKNLKGVITDFTECKNNATINELNKIVAFYKKNNHIFKHIKLAVVLDTPNVVILLMFEDIYSEIHHKAFSTYDAALAWVKK